ncbi:MAG: hypothetical protein AAF797_00250 [Planctomycetota bacterium]
MLNSKTPVVLIADIYYELSDFDQLDLAVLLARPEFNVRGIMVDQMRTEWGARQHDPSYLQGLCRRFGHGDVPVIAGVSEPLSSPGVDWAEQPAVQFLHEQMREAEGDLVVFCWASMTDVMAAWNSADPATRDGLAAVYAHIGWYHEEIYPHGIKTRRQWENNVQLDQAAFFALFASDAPVVWLPCNVGAWYYPLHQRFADKRGELYRWLERELYHYKLIRDLKARREGGRQLYFVSDRDCALFNPDQPAPPEQLGDPIRVLETMDRPDIERRPVLIYETASTYHAVCTHHGRSADGLRVIRSDLAFGLGDDGVPVMTEDRVGPNGKHRVIVEQSEDVLAELIEASVGLLEDEAVKGSMVSA